MRVQLLQAGIINGELFLERGTWAGFKKQDKARGTQARGVTGGGDGSMHIDKEVHWGEQGQKGEVCENEGKSEEDFDLI